MFHLTPIVLFQLTLNSFRTGNVVEAMGLCPSLFNYFALYLLYNNVKVCNYQNVTPNPPHHPFLGPFLYHCANCCIADYIKLY